MPDFLASSSSERFSAAFSALICAERVPRKTLSVSMWIILAPNSVTPYRRVPCQVLRIHRCDPRQHTKLVSDRPQIIVDSSDVSPLGRIDELPCGPHVRFKLPARTGGGVSQSGVPELMKDGASPLDRPQVSIHSDDSLTVVPRSPPAIRHRPVHQVHFQSVQMM